MEYIQINTVPTQGANTVALFISGSIGNEIITIQSLS